MQINETAKQCHLTKKAIAYYCEQGLVQPTILENGYRDFSEQDAELLNKIVLYRKLGLNIPEIKRVLADRENLKGIIHKKVLELEEEKVKQSILEKIYHGEALLDLEEEIHAINSKSIIIQKLMELFPSYYGKLISLNFSRYLTGKIETSEQMEAFQEIITFFDNVPDMELPEDLREYLDYYLEEYSGEAGVDKINSILQAKEESIENMEEFVENNRKILEDYMEYKKTEEFQHSPANRMMMLLKQFCSANGYYETFIPAMRKLSPLYNKYYEQMLKADELFRSKYPTLQE